MSPHDRECQHDCYACKATCQGLRADAAFLAGVALGCRQTAGEPLKLCPAHAVALGNAMQEVGGVTIQVRTDPSLLS